MKASESARGFKLLKIEGHGIFGYDPSVPVEWAKAIARSMPWPLREESPNWTGHGGW